MANKTYEEVQAEINARLKEKKLRQERIQFAINHIKQDPERFNKLKSFVDSKIKGSTDHHGYCIGSACYSLTEAKEILSYTSGTKLQDDIVSGKLKGYVYDYNLDNIERGDILQLDRMTKTGKRGAPYHNMLVEHVTKDSSGKVKGLTYFGSQGSAESFDSHDLDSNWVNSAKNNKNYQIVKKEFVPNSLLKERNRLKPPEPNIIRRDIDYVPNETIRYTGSSDKYPEKTKARNEHINAMMSRKQQLMKAYNLSNDEFNNLVKVSAGIIDQESEFGTSTRYALKQIPGVQFMGKILTGHPIDAFDSGQYSEGAGQIKEDYFPKKAGAKFGISPESKESTLLTVLDRYTTQVPSELRGKPAGYLKTVNSYKGMRSDTNEYAKSVLDKASSYGLSDYATSKEDLNKYKTEKKENQAKAMRDAFNVNQDGTMKSNNYKPVGVLKNSKGGTVKKYAPGGIDLIGTIDPSTISNLTKPFQSKMPVTGASASAASGIGSNFKLPSLGGGGSSAPQQTSQDPNAPVKKNTGKTVGSLIGGIGGAVLGSVVPGLGTAIGGMAGSAIGGGIGGAIDKKNYQNKVEDYTANKSSQQNAMTSNIAGNFNPNAQGKQFKKGGELIKRADGSYSKRGLWDNIRANKGSGKAPTKAMLEQERKIKANMADGGKLPKDILKSRLESHMSSEQANKYLQEYKEGGIHIKESKKGTFTAAASKHGKSVQGFASQVLANKENYSPAMVKKANFARNAAKWHHAMGGIDTSNSMSGPKYVNGGVLKPMGNDMYEVKSNKKGTDKVEYRPNVFIDNKEIIRKNPDGSTQILSDDLGYAKVAKNIARAKGGNITDEQFDQLYNAQEMSKASKGKGNKYVIGGTDGKDDTFGGLIPSNTTQQFSENIDILPFDAGKPKIESIKSKSLAPMSIDKINSPSALIYSTGPKNTKDFQDWLDVNQPTWLKGKSLNKGVGYGTYGDNTTAAYKKYGSDYEAMIARQKANKELNLKPMPVIGRELKQQGSVQEPMKISTPSLVPSMPTNPDLGNKPLDTKVNPLGYLSTLPSAAYDIGLGLKGADPVNFDRMNTKYQFADPRGAMAAASRGVTSAYNAAKNAARTTATSAGEYLANMGTLASKEGIDRASALANIKAQYDMANTQGLNQTNLTKDQYNAQVQMNESIARQQEKDAARSSISKGLTGLSQNTMSYMADVNANKTQRSIIDLINSGEYEFVYDANGKIKLLPKKGAKSNSVEVTPSPTTQTEPAKAEPAKK